MEIHGTPIFPDILVANVSEAITVGESVAVKVADANPDRSYFKICVDPNDQGKQVWLRLYPAADDNRKCGIVLFENGKGSGCWEMIGKRLYKGEISVISRNNENDVYITEY